MSNGSEHIPETTHLEGETERGPLNTYAANAGEFAARWNSTPPEGRDAWVRKMVENSQMAMACWAALHEHQIAEQRSRIAALEAVIRAREFDGQQTVNGVTDRGYLSPEEWREEKIALILDTAPSVVLDQVIREAKAEAVEAARDAIMPPVNWNLRPDGTEMPGTEHIDGALHDIHVQLTALATETRNGDA